MLLVLTTAAAAWYFVLREAPPSSAFVRATDRFVAAARQVRSEAESVSRFLDLPDFQASADAQFDEMLKQLKTFERLARTEEGEARRLARQAVDAGERGSFAASWYARAITSRRLTTALRANGELGAAIVELEALADEWDKLSD